VDDRVRDRAGGRAAGAGSVLVLAVLGSLLLLPLLPLLLWVGAGSWPPGDLLPAPVPGRGLRLVGDDRVLAAAGTSTLVATLVATLACLVGLPAGRALGLHEFRGRRLVQFLLLAPVLVPPIAVALGLQVTFLRLGLAGTVTGVVLVHLVPTVPYAATLLGAAYANLGDAHERQARVLGAGPWRAVRHASLPLLRPVLLTTWLLTFLVSWSEYVLTLLIGGGRVTTLPLLVFSAVESSDRTAAAALGLAVVVPPVLLVLLAARTLASERVVAVGLARA
jgi:putative spermidine/putrescine transport system permease protein